MKQRGLERILIIVSDNLQEINQAIEAAYPINTKIQKSVVHQIHNRMKVVRHDEKK